MLDGASQAWIKLLFGDAALVCKVAGVDGQVGWPCGVACLALRLRAQELNTAAHQLLAMCLAQFTDSHNLVTQFLHGRRPLTRARIVGSARVFQFLL